MIFNMTGGGGSKTAVFPEYTGTMNVVYLSGDGAIGYIEFTSSGTLTWKGGKAPKTKFDLFCVGAGASGNGNDYDNVKGGGGGGSGYTTTVTGVTLPESVDIVIGAGGTASAARNFGKAGGTTSIGELCSAAGGNPGTTLVRGGNGGSGGGAGNRCNTSTNYNAGAGGSNGGSGSSTSGTYGGAGGSGQGIPTTDLLGRIHAGGGSGCGGIEAAAGTSNFAVGKGGNSSTNGYSMGYGGGGYGGGGGGGCYTYGVTNIYSGAGGQGFAMIAWGDYLSIINEMVDIEYIEANGTQYIDTGYKPNEKTKLVVRGEPSSAGALYCAVNSNGRCGVYLFSGNIDMAFGSSGYLAATKSVSYPETITLSNGELQSSSGTFTFAAQSAFQITATLPIFSDGSSRSPGGRCSLFQIYEGDVLVKEFISKKKTWSGEIGMYESVSGEFYKNAGTGTFIAGPEV